MNKQIFLLFIIVSSFQLHAMDNELQGDCIYLAAEYAKTRKCFIERNYNNPLKRVLEEAQIFEAEEITVNKKKYILVTPQLRTILLDGNVHFLESELFFECKGPKRKFNEIKEYELIIDQIIATLNKKENKKENIVPITPGPKYEYIEEDGCCTII